MRSITANIELENLKKQDLSFGILFYGDFSQQSLDSYQTLEEIDVDKFDLFSVDVQKVKDIHKQYKVENVPTLLVFNVGKAVKWITGNRSRQEYLDIIQNKIEAPVFVADKADNAPRIEVYSTPSCTYCTMLKNYLTEKKIKYRDIDISRDSKAADDLVKKTGQTGVPQTYINGTHVMGFDRNKINELLKIK